MTKHTYSKSGNTLEEERVITVFLRNEKGENSAELVFPVTLRHNEPQSHDDLIEKEFRRVLSEFGSIGTLGKG